MEAIILIIVEVVSVCAIIVCLNLCGYDIDVSIYKRVPDYGYGDDDDGDDMFVNLPVNFGPYSEDEPDDDEDEDDDWGNNKWNPVNRIMNDVNLN